MANYGLVAKYQPEDYWPNIYEYWPATGDIVPAIPAVAVRIFTPAITERMFHAGAAETRKETVLAEGRVLNVGSSTRKYTQQGKERTHKVEKP